MTYDLDGSLFFLFFNFISTHVDTDVPIYIGRDLHMR